ncbi:hypothetical protein FHS29_004189 [Saccharothrix tamanrassetensis]|uniref:Uncharacterized protein n=1 Tax=Saccharothrix tamanrassetensis TaxID=1051531 RepID=A0A841CMK0_9PSEU|nr:hypothetical protein [Saccharothrix tamanrassetensis]MBB5957594.1 hypothetical protein [Saccharothrix tamanrassetensis]
MDEFDGKPHSSSMTAAAERYEQAGHRALAALDDATDRGGPSWTREELYER